MNKPVLTVENLHKTYGALTATNDVSLTLRVAEIHALIGPNGAGKSTFISQVAGETIPNSGRITMGDTDITKLSVAARAQAGLGRSFQVSSLAMPETVRSNIALAVQAQAGSSFRFWRKVRTNAQIQEAVDATLDRVGLSNRAEVSVATLSHGERRLVELACALALQPRLLLLDEPMAGLGQEGANVMTQFLAELKSDIPILLVEHDMDAVFRLADRITVLVDGRVIAQATPAEIRADKAVREAYLGEDI